MIPKELVAASTRPLLLSLLAEGESYGYALIERVRELSHEGMEWTEGMLYPVLHRLEEEGLIESRWQEAGSGRKRKYYRLSRTGQSALHEERKQWLTVHETLMRVWKRNLGSTWSAS